MTATGDWPQIDGNSIALPTSVTSSDLFGGELFGDELIDMYNSGVAAVGSESSGVADIPTILPSSNSEAAQSEKTNSSAGDQKSSDAASGAPPIDDGLGAFRPSTSFNDLPNLLNSSEQSKASSATPATPATASATSAVSTSSATPIATVENASKTKKRTRAEGDTDPSTQQKKENEVAPVSKKRATPKEKNVSSQAKPARVSKGIVHQVKPSSLADRKQSSSEGNNKSVVQGKSSDDTPNPLVTPSLPNVAGTRVIVPAGVVAQAPPSNATVVTPSTRSAPAPAPTPTPATVTSHPHGAVVVSVTHAGAPAPTQTPAALASSDSLSMDAANAVQAAAAAAAAAAVVANPAPVVSSQPPAAAAPAPGTTTEESFKGVAQAAVTNLILTASSGKATASKHVSSVAPVTDDDSSDGADAPVNTSSSHIAALTSSNWVAACSASVANAATPASSQAAALAVTSSASDSSSSSKAARTRRANLTPDERARQNRDRNREHARNTRLRKKAYVEELKRTLTELVSQRDAQELERRHEAQRDLEVREVRFRVMEEFLKLRSRGNESSKGGATASNLLARWVAILEDGFTLTLPRTEFRSMVKRFEPTSPKANGTLTPSVAAAPTTVSTPGITEIQYKQREQILAGASEVMEDAGHLATFLNTMGTTQPSNGAVRIAYHCDRKKFMMDGCNAVLDWTASTIGAVSQGAQSELVLKGSMRATFSPASNKLVSSELLFDTGSVISQIKTHIPPPAAVPSPVLGASVTTESQPQGLPPLAPVSAPPPSDPCDVVAAAAAAAANEADALLDSLQMPHLATVSMLPPIAASNAPTPAPTPSAPVLVAAPPPVPSTHVAIAPGTAPVTSSQVAVKQEENVETV